MSETLKRIPPAAYLMISAVWALFTIGLIMVFDTSSAEAIDALKPNTHHALYKQLLSAALGLFLASACWHLGYERLLEKSHYFLIGVTFLLVLTYVPGLGRTFNGAKRWVGILGLTLQPSEFAKFVMPMYLLSKLYVAKKHGALNLACFWRNCLHLLPAFLLILFEPDNRSCILLLASFAVVFYLVDVPKKFWLVPGLAFSLVVGTVAIQLPYVRGRISSFMNPGSDIRGKGHQPYQAKIAVGSGQFVGRGLGKSLQKLSYLPEAQNDYIAAIYAEELGFLGIFVLVFLYALVAVCGLQLTLSRTQLPAILLGSLIVYLISIQAFINLGVVCGLLPSTGLNLPFFSQGGTSLLSNMAQVAFLLSLVKPRSTRAVRLIG